MKRTIYMEYLMTSTYQRMAIIAIKEGKLEGAWEKAIAEQLGKDAICSNVFRLMDAHSVLKLVTQPDEIWGMTACLKAAKFIINLKELDSINQL